MKTSASKLIATQTALKLIQAIREFAKTAAVRDLQRIADVAEELAIDAEEREEDALARIALNMYLPQKGDVIEFERVSEDGHLEKVLTATVLLTPEKGSRRLCITGLTQSGRQHIMLKRVVGIVSRAATAKKTKGSRP